MFARRCQMNFTELLKSGRVIVWDGAMGTNLTLKCVRAGVFKFSCNEELNLTHPQIVREIHEEFLAAGAQVLEANTFGANRIVLAEHGLADKVREINFAAVRIAKEEIKKIPPGGFVAADIGPTSRLPTLGHISFNEMVEAYKEQASILIEAGVDILQVVTCQDILQTKAAVIGCKEALSEVIVPSDHRTIALVVTITIEPSGTMLLGTDIGAALASVASLGIDAFGLNCATGPAEMEEHLRYLSDFSPIPIVALPNAGLPEIKDGKAHYPLGADEFAEWMEYFVKELGVQIVGGCCGTTPEHIAEVRKRLSTYLPKSENLNTYALKHSSTSFISSLYSAVSIDQEPRPLIIGERMNINGSKEFREHILKDDFDAAAQMAKKQADTGAHILDLSIAYAGRDEVKDIGEISRRLAKTSPLPIMVDSTNPDAISAALSHLGGRSVINSINLEDGGAKAKKIIEIAKRHGSVLVALTIDEEGMALTADKKISVAKRIVEFCMDHGFTGEIFIDPLTFTLADPKAAEFGSGRETLEAIKLLKQRTILGVSNISYGLKPDARRVLNSVFLHETVLAGLDAAIVHAGQILPLHKIDKPTQQLAKDLIFCRKKGILEEFLAYFEAKNAKTDTKPVKTSKKLSKSDILRGKILDGDKTGLAELIKDVLTGQGAENILNDILLPSMQKVGDMFGAGELQLPFVLQSAEVMREASDILSPYFKACNIKERCKMVLATVRGDVHDIGKNLVDIILTNNGYKVHNLGVKQPVEAVIKAVQETGAGIIGLSGLLVQSCLVMKEDLIELNHRQINLPIICGGAALTRKFVEDELQKVYKGKVYYAKDAFEGLKIMRSL